ncbi:MAG: xanthine dehydrogenase family protein subunit M [Thermincola sp.]|jgi:4-hydroxybenzoyl-CoA reductase subunit beta|nr:xanthine dehydrogenase family protein subunit M [Thermincola sp.]MDT3702999.1 xanthine dehydrogenase family protein subunit M [Thermincola sp.]
MAANYQYHGTLTLDQALSQLRELGPQAVVKAGGTDVYLRVKQGITNPGHLVDIGGLKELNYITYDQGSGLKIGAMTTVRDLERSSVVREKYPVLAEAASKVASVQIRNMGTLAGNLCQDNMCWYYNQSRLWKETQPPCFKAGGSKCHLIGKEEVCYATYRGDLAPVLIAMGAVVRLQSAADERILPLDELYSGEGKESLTLKAGEMVTEIKLPPLAANSAACYIKRSHRKAVDYPLVGVAACVTADAEGKVANAKLVLTAVGSGPVVVAEAAKIMLGRTLSDIPLDEIDQLARQQAKPVNNVYHGTAKYRKQMAGLLSKRCISLAAANLTVKEV